MEWLEHQAVGGTSAATGTAMRASTFQEHARAARFARVEVLPIDNDLWRFYRLVP
jgi:hypothetical protein